MNKNTLTWSIIIWFWSTSKYVWTSMDTLDFQKLEVTLLLLILITGKFCMKGSVTLCKERKPMKSEHQRKYLESSLYSSVQSLSRVWRLTTPWTAARQFSLSITSSQSLFKLMPIESVVPSNHLILCRSLLLLPSIFPSINLKKILPPAVSLDLLFNRFEFGKWVPLIPVLQTISSGIRIFIETISMNS